VAGVAPERPPPAPPAGAVPRELPERPTEPGGTPEPV
jgi:hypothetical protein